MTLMLALPVLYAVFSLGPVHAEGRYTRYVQLSYIAALCVVLEALYLRLCVGHRKVANRFRQGVAAAAVFATLYSLGSWTLLAAKNATPVETGIHWGPNQTTPPV
jgi:hypothetical protein